MKFNSNGKLMITGEYLALDNALVLTLPTKFGQSLDIQMEQGNGLINWTSYTNDNETWFTTTLSIHNNTFKIISSSDLKIAQTLFKILESANQLSPENLNHNSNYSISTYLEFPQNWGLGSSSTLINNIAQWFKVDPFQLHFSVFNGSGYDVAAAYSNNAITYQINDKKPIVNQINFNPPFKENLFFVHLNQKQNSFNEVKKYQKNKNKIEIETAIISTNQITAKMIDSSSLKEFENLIIQHEIILSSILRVPTIQSQLFSDYKDGVIKSLGAWGGDFILVTGNRNSRNYFKKKGYHTILSFKEMII